MEGDTRHGVPPEGREEEREDQTEKKRNPPQVNNIIWIVVPFEGEMKQDVETEKCLEELSRIESWIELSEYSENKESLL